MPTRRAVLATGGIGGLFSDTTNPPGSCGQGLALAACAGAEFADLEFVQFHPTALDGPRRPMPLVSEAVRGEGAVLVDEQGERFLAETPGGELAPRDVVARAVWRPARCRTSCVPGRPALSRAEIRQALSGDRRLCATQAGIDPAIDPIPVRPAAHYHMGGVAVDAEGRSSVERLVGMWRGRMHRTARRQPACQQLADRSGCHSAAGWLKASPTYHTAWHRPSVPHCALRPDPSRIRPIVSAALGIVRDGETLRDAVATLLPIAARETALPPIRPWSR